MANIIDLGKLNEKLDTLLKNQEAGIPRQEPQALTESMAPKYADYKDVVVKAFRAGAHDTMNNQTTTMQFLNEAIGDVDGTAACPTIWSRDVTRCCPYPASAFLGAPFIKWHTDIKGQPGATLNVVVVGRATGGTISCEEPTSTAPTITATAIGLTDYQCSVDICRDDLEDMVTDTVSEINNSLISCLDEWIDNYFIAGIVGSGSTILPGVGLGTFSANTIAQAIGSMRSGTCSPRALIIHPAIEARLMQDSQFVNAATFGDRSVITDGHIIKYLGLDIVVVPKGSLYLATGTYRSLLLGENAVHAAMKRDPTIETQYYVNQGKRVVMASTRLGKAVVCNNAVVWILSLA